jgi:hypothetical protein
MTTVGDSARVAAHQPDVAEDVELSVAMLTVLETLGRPSARVPVATSSWSPTHEAWCPPSDTRSQGASSRLVGQGRPSRLHGVRPRQMSTPLVHDGVAARIDPEGRP